MYFPDNFPFFGCTTSRLPERSLPQELILVAVVDKSYDGTHQSQLKFRNLLFNLEST